MERIAIQSLIDNMPLVEDFLSKFCDEHHINNYFAIISVPVLQAVENAICHGNASDPNKIVTIVADNCKGGVAFTIEDQGSGFDFQKYVGSVMEEATGIFLMQSLSDSMEYSNGGRTLRLEFKINGIDGSDALERISCLQHFYMTQSVVA